MFYMRLVNSLILAAALGSGVALAEQSAEAEDDSQTEGSVTQDAGDTADSGSGDDEALGKPYAEDSESVAGTVDESGSDEGRENKATGDQSAGGSGNSGDQRPAADSERPGADDTGFLDALDEDHLLGAEMLGSTLVNTSDEEVGEINELVISRDGRLIAVVVGVGGMLGLGEKSLAVAWDELEIEPAEDGGKPVVRTTLDREALEAAPELGD